MEPEGWLPCLEELAIFPYPESQESSPTPSKRFPLCYTPLRNK